MAEKPMILIVEDSAIIRETLRGILKDEYRMIEAGDGATALRILEQESENLSAVMLDLYMPVMSGEELLIRISEEERFHDLPILVATGVNDIEVEKRCLKLGA